jgi:serine protease Do
MNSNVIKRGLLFLNTLIVGTVIGLLPLKAQAELPDFTKLVEDNDDAVVNISTSRTVKAPTAPPMGAMPYEDMPPGPFQDFFKHFFDEMGPPQGGREFNGHSLGSGFIVSPDGYVVTNNHVIREADEIEVRLEDGRFFKAKVVGTDERSDLALLKIDATGLPTTKFGSSENLKIGEWVLAIGSPFGFEHSVTAGIVSAKGRGLRTEQYVPFIQTDVAINPGNSGGPLFNLKGEVVGINSQIVSNGGGYVGLSFAVPSEIAKNVIEQLKTKGYVTRSWLGVSLQPVDATLAESFGLPKNEGALIADVVEKGPAAEAGLKPGDVILKIAGKRITNSADVPHLVGNITPGTVLDVDIIRDKKAMSVKVKVTELPREEEEQEEVEVTADKTKNPLGVQVRNLEKEEMAKFQLMRKGVVVEGVKPKSPAATVGMRPGDIIFRIGPMPVESVDQFNEIMKKVDANVKLIAVLVGRPGEGQRYLAIRLDQKKKKKKAQK